MSFSVFKPLPALAWLLALMALGEYAAVWLSDRWWPRPDGVNGLIRLCLLCLPLMLAVLPLLWRLRRDAEARTYERVRAGAVLGCIAEGVIVVDAAGRVEYLNGVAAALTGWPLGEALGRDLAEVYRVAGEDPPGLAAGPPLRRTLFSRDGTRLSIDVSVAAIPGASGVGGAVLAFRDATARRQAEDELKLSASVFADAAEGIIITDAQGVILRVNKAFAAITGYAEQEVLGKTPRLLSSGRHDKAFYQTMWERLVTAGEWQGELWNRRKSGEIYPEWLRIRAISGERGETTHYVGVFADISERVRDQESIFRLAYYDSLTALANRALLMDHLEMAIGQAHRHGMAVAVLYIDLDRFKLVNDSLGHAAGDLLLQNMARTLSACVREGDTVSRFGSDEFVVCLTDISGEYADAVRDALRLAEKIQRRLSLPFSLLGHEMAVTPSMGVALYPWHGGTPALLVRHADTAMYHAKTQGRDNVQLFSEAMLSAGSERLHLQSALRKALESQEFRVYYQPQVELCSGRVVGAEALLRWNSAELGWISPAQFIPVAEDTSLILPIGDWVLKQVCQDIKAWQGRFGERLGLSRVAINFSPRQFVQADFVGRIMRELQASGVGPDCLEVEITEATLMHNIDAALGALGQLRGAGIRIAVDDFGVGYSSLSYLKKFPIDVLKIDQSFVRDLSTDSSDAQIVRAIVAMGHSLNLKVLAEGVETLEQLAFLRGEGCEEAQGFLFSPPVPAEAFAELLRLSGEAPVFAAQIQPAVTARTVRAALSPDRPPS